MEPAQLGEDKKDKRLLVLLAFGIFILLGDLFALLPARPVASPSWIWEEDEGGVVRRRNVPAEMDRVGQGADPAPASPRLSFLLGRPMPVNRASAEELALLDGIGPKLAESIIRHRETHGWIKDIHGLREVAGIGAKLAERLAPQLTFD